MKEYWDKTAVIGLVGFMISLMLILCFMDSSVTRWWGYSSACLVSYSAEYMVLCQKQEALKDRR